MGVNGLWPAIELEASPVSSADLENRVLAVDLSIWVVEASSSPRLAAEHAHPHLYLVYSRATFLLRLGARLVVVVEGARDPRKRVAGSDAERSRAGVEALRTRGAACVRVLRALGVPCVTAAGEAEATCAALNAAGVADAVLTEDGDAFLCSAPAPALSISSRTLPLYVDGARRVIRGATVSGVEAGAARLYDRARFRLGWSRRDFVALGLCCGTDLDAGVPGVGGVTAAAFIASRRGEVRSLERRNETPPAFSESMPRRRSTRSTRSARGATAMRRRRASPPPGRSRPTAGPGRGRGSPSFPRTSNPRRRRSSVDSRAASTSAARARTRSASRTRTPASAASTHTAPLSTNRCHQDVRARAIPFRRFGHRSLSSQVRPRPRPRARLVSPFLIFKPPQGGSASRVTCRC